MLVALLVLTALVVVDEYWATQGRYYEVIRVSGYNSDHWYYANWLSKNMPLRRNATTRYSSYLGWQNVHRSVCSKL